MNRDIRDEILGFINQSKKFMKKLYFERAKENRGEIPTTFIYDKISDEVKTQIILVWSSTHKLSYWSKEIVLKLRESFGRFKLVKEEKGTRFL